MMHVIFRDGLEERQYLTRYASAAETPRASAEEYPPERSSRITGMPVETIERLGTGLRHDGPAFIRLNYGMQRHGGGGMAVRTISLLPAVTGAWTTPAAAASSPRPARSRITPRHRAARSHPAGPRTINMMQLAEALTGDPRSAGEGARRLQLQSRRGASRSRARTARLAARGPVHRRARAVPDRHRRLCRHRAAGDDAARARRHPQATAISTSTLNRRAIAPLAKRSRTREVFRLMAAKMGFEKAGDISGQRRGTRARVIAVERACGVSAA